MHSWLWAVIKRATLEVTTLDIIYSTQNSEGEGAEEAKPQTQVCLLCPFDYAKVLLCLAIELNF